MSYAEENQNVQLDSQKLWSGYQQCMMRCVFAIVAAEPVELFARVAADAHVGKKGDADVSRTFKRGLST